MCGPRVPHSALGSSVMNSSLFPIRMEMEFFDPQRTCQTFRSYVNERKWWSFARHTATAEVECSQSNGPIAAKCRPFNHPLSGKKKFALSGKGGMGHTTPTLHLSAVERKIGKIGRLQLFPYYCYQSPRSARRSPFIFASRMDRTGRVFGLHRSAQ